MEQEQIILSFDPGSRKLGWAVLSDKAVLFGQGVIIASQNDRIKRFRKLFEAIVKLFERYRPTVVVIESAFVSFKNAVIPLAQVQGLILALSFLNKAEVFFYSPSVVKQSVLKGNATKQQVRNCIKKRFALNDLQIDASDAIAVGLCFLQKKEIMK